MAPCVSVSIVSITRCISFVPQVGCNPLKALLVRSYCRQQRRKGLPSVVCADTRTRKRYPATAATRDVLFVTDRKPISQKRDIDVGLANEERLDRISQRGGRTLLSYSFDRTESWRGARFVDLVGGA